MEEQQMPLFDYADLELEPLRASSHSSYYQQYEDLKESIRQFVRWFYCQEDDPEEILVSLGDMLTDLIDEDPGPLWETREKGRDFYGT
jgi:hypothetical protein